MFVVRRHRHHQNARARIEREHSAGDAHLRGDIAAAHGKTITARRIAAGNRNFRNRHRPFRHLRARADNAHCQRRRVNDINRHRRAHCQRRRRAVRRLNINIIHARRRRRNAAQRARQYRLRVGRIQNQHIIGDDDENADTGRVFNADLRSDDFRSRAVGIPCFPRVAAADSRHRFQFQFISVVGAVVCSVSAREFTLRARYRHLLQPRRQGYSEMIAGDGARAVGGKPVPHARADIDIHRRHRVQRVDDDVVRAALQKPRRQQTLAAEQGNKRQSPRGKIRRHRHIAEQIDNRVAQSQTRRYRLRHAHRAGQRRHDVIRHRR